MSTLQPLNEDEKNRIAHNRMKAIAIFEAKREEEIKNSVQRCSIINSDGSLCNSTLIKGCYYENFGEIVCKNCAYESDSMKLLTRTDLKTKYLLTDYTIDSMRHRVIDNPRNKGWTPMQLYLRKHALEKAVEKWGSVQLFEEEIKRREDKKFLKSLEKVQNVFANSDENDGLTIKIGSKRKRSNILKAIAKLAQPGKEV